MLINVEFFDDDPIENVITSLNYKVDKTLFFGYSEVLEKHKDNVAKFLQKTGQVQCVEFCAIDDTDLSKIIQAMKERLSQEKGQDNVLFFDLTGGESLPLVAFGVLSKEFNASMHMFNVRSNEMFEYRNEDGTLLSEIAKHEPIQLNLDKFISLYGGKINYAMHKDSKDLTSPETKKGIGKMWYLSRKYNARWPHYSALLRSLKPDSTDLHVNIAASQVLAELKKNPQAGKVKEFNEFLDECASLGFITDLKHQDGIFNFTYKNPIIKNYFWDSGGILEMFALTKMRKEHPGCDCKAGVHIDWDGIIHPAYGEDVLNEIDIMLIDNNLPIFVSCKNGNVNQMVLYELETVANRFGGKYATKILMVTKNVAPGHLRRAKEMGIEVRRMS